jgi:hypothetical protein
MIEPNEIADLPDSGLAEAYIDPLPGDEELGIEDFDAAAYLKMRMVIIKASTPLPGSEVTIS